jgi:arsenate reductase
MRILFLGCGNDCRTLLAEAIFNHLAPPGCKARRASCDQAGPPDPAALSLLAKQGIQTDPKAAEPPNVSPSEGDVLITVCSVGAEQTCPCCGPDVLRAHWGVHQPARRRKVLSARDNTELLDLYHILRARIERLIVLVQAGIETDRPRLERELERIGHYLP